MTPDDITFHISMVVCSKLPNASCKLVHGRQYRFVKFTEVEIHVKWFTDHEGKEIDCLT